MNLHEECLLKYLSNPTSLSNLAELLKYNNSLIEKGLSSNIAINSSKTYSVNRK